MGRDVWQSDEGGGEMKVSDLIKALQGCEDLDISFSFQMMSASFLDIHAFSNIEI